MNQPLVNLRIDFAFKELFGLQVQEKLLISFLHASLYTQIVSLKLVPLGYLSYRDVSELLRKRSISVHPTTIMRWVHQYGNLIYQM